MIMFSLPSAIFYEAFLENKKVMTTDFSWAYSAKEYEKLYADVLSV